MQMFCLNIRKSALALVLILPSLASAQYENARIEKQQIADGFHVLFGVGEGVIAGNIGVSIGEQGVLIVDDQFPEIAPKYKAAIRELGGGDVDFVTNTHWHFDHADGNKALGPEGTWIVAQENSRDMLLKDNVINLVSTTIDQPMFPAAALPTITYARQMSLHFNGERIDLMHAGPAHTTGDTAVIFRGRNAVHLGDVFNTSGYPFIDADNGGSLSGVIAFCQAVIEELDANSIVIPGHGAVSNYQGLADYIAMLSTVRDRIQALVASGASLEQVVAARPTAEWDARQGDPGSFINRAYTSMAR
jgi:glyoxylase-like metal-dependent hydrolase (beta-lactamase superfamily II)